MKQLLIILVPVLFLAVNGAAAPLAARDSPVKESQGASEPPGDVNNPEDTLPTWEQRSSPQSSYFGKKSDRPVSAHKINYFAIDRWPGNNHAQVKFQISMKFRVLEPNLYVLKYNLFPAYIAYSQKSLWNAGSDSMPFEESNYNPEFFLDYPVSFFSVGRIKLRNIVVCLLEHQSNGLNGVQSRSWNRQYVMFKFGIESRERLEIANSFLADKASLYVKLWQASGYSTQDDYLRALGRDARFPDYMGRGEVGVSVRNFLWRGSFKNHQLEVKTPIFRDPGRDSYEVEFRQQFPYMNFAIYLQYWHGYGETLLRFDRYGRRGFAGLSFSY